MSVTEMGCHSRVNTCSIQKSSLFYSSRVTAADRAGQEASISYSQWNIWEFWKHSTAPFSCHPTTKRRELQNSDKLQTADCSCWLAKSPKVTDQLESLQKDQHFESLSSFQQCIYLDQIIFLLDFHDSICCHIANSSECLCPTDNQWVGKLLQALMLTRALLISVSLKHSWSNNLEEILHYQVLVMTFLVDSSLCQQRLPVHSSRNWEELWVLQSSCFIDSGSVQIFLDHVL